MLAQTTVSGTLIDEETNEPLIGATVQVKGLQPTMTALSP